MWRLFLFFFFNDTATTEIYTLSLHDALPISNSAHLTVIHFFGSSTSATQPQAFAVERRDRKSTRLNSSHSQISYAVFCLKKKKIETPKTNCISSAAPVAPLQRLTDVLIYSLH